MMTTFGDPPAGIFVAQRSESEFNFRKLQLHYYQRKYAVRNVSWIPFRQLYNSHSHSLIILILILFLILFLIIIIIIIIIIILILILFLILIFILIFHNSIPSMLKTALRISGQNN